MVIQPAYMTFDIFKNYKSINHLEGNSTPNLPKYLDNLFRCDSGQIRFWRYRFNSSITLTHLLFVSGHGSHGILVLAEINVGPSARPAIWTKFNQQFGQN